MVRRSGTELRVNTVLPNGATRTVSSVTIEYSSPVTVSYVDLLNYAASYTDRPAGSHVVLQSSGVYSNVSSSRTDLVVAGDHELKLHRLRLEGPGVIHGERTDCATATATPTTGFCPAPSPTVTEEPTWTEEPTACAPWGPCVSVPGGNPPPRRWCRLPRRTAWCRRPTATATRTFHGQQHADAHVHADGDGHRRLQSSYLSPTTVAYRQHP
jgi:hypothetical protein